MANVNRYRRGPRTLVQVPVESATEIDKGELVCISSGYGVLPSTLTNEAAGHATAAAAKNAVANALIGVAETATASGETEDILVDVSLEAIYEFDQTTAADISFGDLIEIDAASTAEASFTAVDTTIVAGSTDQIAVCVKEHTTEEGKGTLIKFLPQSIFNDVSGQG